MSQSAEIQKCEEQLKEAMLQSNISVLDTLLADDLIFINHLGQIMTKHDDIEAHKSKSYIINEITLSEQKIKIFENIAIVTVKAHIPGYSLFLVFLVGSIFGDITKMKPHYDFSKMNRKNNPYINFLKQPVTLPLDYESVNISNH